MAPHDPDYCRRERAALYRRRRLLVLAAACALTLSTFGLITVGPSDSHIEATP